MLKVETFKQEATDREVGELQRSWNPSKGELKFKKLSEGGMYQVWYVAPKGYDAECVICQNEGPRENAPNGRHQHVYEGQE